MKRFLKPFLLILCFLSLTACHSLPNIDAQNKEGIYPYELSEREAELLQAFGMSGNSLVLSFHAPQEATSLIVNTYTLNESHQWVGSAGGGLYLSEDRKPSEVLAGLFTIQLQDDFMIEYNITCGGRSKFTTPPIYLPATISSSSRAFLQDFQEIKLNREIPIAMMIYDSGTTMRSYSMDDFFEPSNFADMDLVQVVTLIFTDE